MTFIPLIESLSVMYRVAAMVFFYLWATVIGTAATSLMPAQLPFCECLGALSSSVDDRLINCCLDSEEPTSMPPCCYEAAPELPDHALAAAVSVTQPGYVVVAVIPDKQLSISALGFSKITLARSSPRGERPAPGTDLSSKQVWRL